MKRRVELILLLLVAGAIVNVAVAWGFALSTDFPEGDYWFARYTSPATVQISVWQRRGVQVIQIQAYGDDPQVRAAEELLRNVGWDFPRFDDYDPAWSSNATFRCGWPCAAVSCEFVQRGDATSTAMTGAVHSFDSSFRYPHPLAVVPIWPGFAINTVFYAGILWLMFAAPFALRRRRRISRGLCPACAYPVGESTVCTECGKPVRQ